MREFCTTKTKGREEKEATRVKLTESKEVALYTLTKKFAKL